MSIIVTKMARNRCRVNLYAANDLIDMAGIVAEFIRAGDHSNHDVAEAVDEITGTGTYEGHGGTWTHEEVETEEQQDRWYAIRAAKPAGFARYTGVNEEWI